MDCDLLLIVGVRNRYKAWFGQSEGLAGEAVWNIVYDFVIVKIFLYSVNG